MKTIAALVLTTTLFLGACSSDEDNGQPASSGSSCLASAMTLKETKVTDSPSGNVIIVDFDVTNTSSSDYDVASGSPLVEIDIEVKTTDGSSYEATSPLTATKVSAGKTASAIFQASYGAGKTYQSYTTKLRCQ